jgi:hypothetical protein
VAAALFARDTPLAVIAVVALISGAGRSVGFTCIQTIAFADIPDDQMRDANTLQATAMQLSLGLGVALGRSDPCRPSVLDVASTGRQASAMRDLTDPMKYEPQLKCV